MYVHTFRALNRGFALRIADSLFIIREDKRCVMLLHIQREYLEVSSTENDDLSYPTHRNILAFIT